MNKFDLRPFFFIATFSVSLSNLAQNANYTPTTPEVASLGKFVETPVGYYSGIPNISIPIHTLSEGELSIPVSLNYHAGGIKVEETASWVGLGWNLSAGGSITRVVRGIPDDHSGGFINVLDPDDRVESLIAKSILVGTGDYFAAADMWDLTLQSLEGTLDYEPDVYHFSFLGYSGSFMFTQDEEIQFSPHSDLLIQTEKDSYNKIIGWVVIVPNGTKYYFGLSKDQQRSAYEEVIAVWPQGESERPVGNVTEWKLLDVESPRGNEIKLTYRQTIYETCTRSGQERWVNGQSTIVGEDPSQPAIDPNHIFPLTYYKNTISSWKLDTIETTNEKMIFSPKDEARIDMSCDDGFCDYALEEIILTDKDLNEIKKYELSYEDIGQTGGLTNVWCSGSDRYFRMYLKAVQETSGAEQLNPYIFTYNSKNLPEKYSYSQDFWGYYNGEVNQSLIPSMTVRNPTYGTKRFLGADRTAVSSFAKAGLLEKIEYPTKGFTEYEYEGNTVGEFEFASDIAPRQPVHIASTSTAEVISDGGGVSVRFYTESFEVNLPQLLDSILYVNVTFPDDCDVETRDCGILVTLLKDGGTYYQEIANSFHGVFEETGTYTLEVTLWLDSETGLYPDLSLNIYGEEIDWSKMSPDGQNFEVGGLRVKNIKTKDSDGSTILEKEFDYSEFDNATESSGNLVSRPLFVETGVTVNDVAIIPVGASEIVVNQQASFDVISSNSNIPFSTTQSNYVGYRNVTEYFGAQGQNIGKKEYTYSFLQDYDEANTSFELLQNFIVTPNTFTPFNVFSDMQFALHSFPPTLQFEWKRGNLLKESTYSFDGQNFFEVQRRLNSFIYYGSDDSQLTNGIFEKNVKGVKIGQRLKLRLFRVYSTRGEWFKLDHSTTTDYYGSDSTVTRTEYTYNEDEEKHVRPIMEETIHSPTESYTTKYFYPQDLASPTVAEQALITDYRIGVPIKTETLKNQDLVSTQYTLFNNTNWPNLNVPEKMQTMHGTPSATNTYTDEVTFHDYDNKGNPVEISQVDGVHTTYVWGYDQTYLIAKIVNATSLQVAAVLGSELALLNGSLLTNAEIKTKINNLRTHASMNDAQVFTYVYKRGYGITSVVDPNGLESKYVYDAFGRLSEVRDHDDNLLQETTYRYKGQ